MIVNADRILVSGLSGVVGSELTVQLTRVADPRVEIVGVFRAPSSFQAFVHAVGLDVAARVMPVFCDLSDAASIASAANGLRPVGRTLAVHAAADVSWTRPLQKMVGPNVEGARNFARLVRASGRSARLIYVSSAFTRTHDWEYRNAYEESKAMAERLLHDEFDDLRPVVFSCSLVAGRTNDGRIARFHGIYPLVNLVECYNVPFLVGGRETRVDLVPVDWVAHELGALLTRLDSAGPECDVPDVIAAAGDDALRLPQLLVEFVAVLNARRLVRNCAPIEPMPVISTRQFRFLRRAADAWDVQGIDHRSLRVYERVLRHYGQYLEDDRVRAPVNVTRPAPHVTSYIGPLVDYWSSHDRRTPAPVG
jgi:nucleoside-diphosphate-sugar epimerase